MPVPLPLVATERASGSVRETRYAFVGRGLDLLTNLLEGLHLLPQALDLLLEADRLCPATSPSSRSARSKAPK